MQKLLPDKILGWTAAQEFESYDRQTIFDYIDGAGEVYLLYDFQKVIVRKYTRPEYQDITVELFDMGSSKDAYGIFSHSHEENDSLVGQMSELRGSLLCFWKNRYYVCVYAEKEDTVANDAILQLAKTIDRNIGDDGRTPGLLVLLPLNGLRLSSIKYFHKYTSLNYHYYLAEDNLLDLDEHTEAVLAIYDPGRAYLLIAKYDDSDAATAALGKFIDGYLPQAKESGLEQIKENKWVYASSISNYVIIAFDAPTEERARELVRSIKIRFPK